MGLLSVFGFFVGAVVVWKFVLKDGTPKTAQMDGVYETNKKAYVKTASKVNREEVDGSFVWTEKTPEDFEIAVLKQGKTDLYVTEKHDGNIEMDPDIIKL